jgi:hypothetical protein
MEIDAGTNIIYVISDGYGSGSDISITCGYVLFTNFSQINRPSQLE